MSVNIGNSKYLSFHIKNSKIKFNCMFNKYKNITTSTCNQPKIINDILYYICHNKSSKSISIVAQFGHDVFREKRNVLLSKHQSCF